MKSRFHKLKMKLLCKISNPYSILFHIVGIACIIWFLVRVLPKPDRAYYPCQQISMTVATTYIVFWIILWSVLFHGLAIWIRRVKTRTAAVLPVILVCFVLIFSISSGVFAGIESKNTTIASSWDPVPNEPIGTPQGVNPGRVVWVWDPEATEENLDGKWWEEQNNDQEVLDEMFSKGIKGLTSKDNEEEAWNLLFEYFNVKHGNGEVGYQPGEKIAIKINLNNCWSQTNPYNQNDNDRDANPYVVKALLRQLVDVVGVAQEDITVYDASRTMANWFYNRVYYESYTSSQRNAEFPDINYVDSTGGATGREKVIASSEKIYFADGTGLYRTLPTCVVEAKYLFNMPLLKRHPIEMGVTLSGKNFFGTWIEPVNVVHTYHTNAFTEGNPAPQTDLLSHEHLGGKTILYIGDGTYPTKDDHRVIGKYNMYPFNDDWTNSLFFSQDPVAIDSVMYDFIHSEGCNPCEGSQNYLHQSAEPLLDTYDPENDGVYLSESLGVHEHWDASVDIFSSDRYVGYAENGIDFITFGEENANSAIVITQPQKDYVYIFGNKVSRFLSTFVIGKIDVKASANLVSEEVEKVEFYIDNSLKFTDEEAPYEWTWQGGPYFKHMIKTIAYYNEIETLEDQVVVWKFL